MKSILVPLDGSPLSEAVLPHVKEMASDLSAGIHLLRVVSITAPDREAFEESVRLQSREAGDYLGSQAEKLKASGFDVDWSVREGIAADEILLHIQENQFDVVAISTHGRSGLGRMVFGSVFDKVMRESGIPVLVIKPTEWQAKQGSKVTLDNERSQMRIAVMGAGAVGGYLGALLARAGHDVSLIARGRHLQAIQDSGLQVKSEQGDFTAQVQATDQPSEIGPVDLVIHAVKTYHNSEAVPMLQPLLEENTTVLCVQNGVDSWEQVQQALPPNTVLPGAVYIEASVIEPGVVQQQGNVRRLVFGEADGSTTPRIQAIGAAMQSAGMPTEISTDITSVLWSKWLFITALAGTTCAAHTGLADLLAAPESRHLVVQVLREIDSLGRKFGVNMDSDIVDKTLHYMETEASSLKASMQKDMELGRPMELEALTGAVVRLGKEAKIPTPANEAIYALLKPHALRT